jgi:SAM-dependent methyltransferase
MTADRDDKNSRQHLRPLKQARERLLWGGRIREKLLVWFLRQNYKSQFRRLWQLNRTKPHFSYHRLAWFLFGFGADRNEMHPYHLFRAFYAAEVLQPTDVVLDIGCGDGFFTKHFLASQCAQVDAIDIDPAAIRIATQTNQRANIRYHLADATSDPFPRPTYDVIVWNGAIGHFSATTAETVLAKIRAALTTDGLFVGSESLGREGHDHLQLFETAADLGALLQRQFANVWTKTLQYRVFNTQFVRNEAYWRCADSTARLNDLNWVRANSSERRN